MPKIIKDLESKLLNEARQQIEAAGYGAMTVRSVAKACGVGVGTVYNYFPSKDALVATYLLQDWQQCIDAIDRVSLETPQPEAVCRCICQQLLSYSRQHQAVFQDSAAAAGFASAFSRYHTMLRSQLALPLRRFTDSDFAAEFAAEALLSWTMAGKAFDEIYGVLQKVF